MALITCIECGNQVSDTAKSCPNCGYSRGTHLNKSKMAAFWLALLLGGFGAHKFYLENRKAGWWYLLFFWTSIPFFLGIIDAFIILGKKQSEFSGTIVQKSSNKPFYPSDPYF